jgi:predicted esterase
LASRVLAFSGRLPASLTKPVQATDLHLFTGALDPLLPLEELRESVLQLQNAGSRTTLDVAENLGHSIDMQLLNRAREYLISY